MRLWCVPTELMCRQHLLGEHVEIHMMVASIEKGKNLGKHLEGQIDTRKIKPRHEELVVEFERRGYNHRSPLREFTDPRLGFVFAPEENLKELAKRCKHCRRIQNEEIWNKN